MPIDYASSVYLIAQDTFGRPVTITPVASQPGQPAYPARGIYSTEPIDDLAEDGAVFSDQRTILDILANEFEVPILQGDLVFVSGVGATKPVPGQFEVIDTDDNGGGEITLTLRKVVPAKPAS